MAAVRPMGTNRVLHRVKVALTADSSIAAGAGGAIAWDKELYDTDGYHDLTTNPSRLTVPAFLTGWYLGVVELTWELFAADALERRFGVLLNGATLEVFKRAQFGAPAAAAERSQSYSGMFYLASTNYVEVIVAHQELTARKIKGYDYGSFFSLHRMGAG